MCRCGGANSADFTPRGAAGTLRAKPGGWRLGQSCCRYIQSMDRSSDPLHQLNWRQRTFLAWIATLIPRLIQAVERGAVQSRWTLGKRRLKRGGYCELALVAEDSSNKAPGQRRYSPEGRTAPESGGGGRRGLVHRSSPSQSPGPPRNDATHRFPLRRGLHWGAVESIACAEHRSRIVGFPL